MVYYDSSAFSGTYGKFRDQKAVYNTLQQISKLLDSLAREQGVSCVVVASDLFVKGTDGNFRPLIAKENDETANAYYKEHLGPIIEKREAARDEWIANADRQMGFHLSA